MKKNTQFKLEDDIRVQIDVLKSQLQIKQSLLQAVPSGPHRNYKFEGYQDKYKGKFRCLDCSNQWSSSLVHVAINYKTYPASFEKFEGHLKRNKKCQIFYFVRLFGQRCGKCKSFKFTSPTFGVTQDRRIIQNFTKFLYNQITQTKIKQQHPCSLKKLSNHISQFCQACKKGKCKNKRTTAQRHQGTRRHR